MIPRFAPIVFVIVIIIIIIANIHASTVRGSITRGIAVVETYANERATTTTDTAVVGMSISSSYYAHDNQNAALLSSVGMLTPQLQRNMENNKSADMIFGATAGIVTSDAITIEEGAQQSHQLHLQQLNPQLQQQLCTCSTTSSSSSSGSSSSNESSNEIRSSTPTVADWKQLGSCNNDDDDDEESQQARVFGLQEQEQLGSGQDNGNGVVISKHPNDGKDDNLLRIAVSSRHHDTNPNHVHPRITATGRVNVYDYDTLTGSYHQVGNVIYGAHNSGEYFGYSMDLTTTTNNDHEESILVVGGIRHHGSHGSYQGVVRVYGLDNTLFPPLWKQLGTDLVGDAFFDHWGHSVAMSRNGQTIVVGAIQHAGNNQATSTTTTTTTPTFAGYVKVLRRRTSKKMMMDHDDSVHWEMVGQKLEGEFNGDKFGNCVAMSASGNLIAVSSPDASNGKGHVKVFGFDGSVWNQVGTTLSGSADTEGHFGSSLSISDSGMVLAVGAPGSDLGAALIFHFHTTSTTGVQEWKLLGEPIMGMRGQGQFGTSVSLSSHGRRVAIGAPRGGPEESGQVQVYEYSTEAKKWLQMGSTLRGQPDGQLGSSVSLVGNHVVASAPMAHRLVENVAHSLTATQHVGVIYSWEWE